MSNAASRRKCGFLRCPEEAKAVYEDDPCPLPPMEPPPEQCCASGCEACVYDHYNAALRQYYRDKAAWDARHAAKEKGAE